MVTLSIIYLLNYLSIYIYIIWLGSVIRMPLVLELLIAVKLQQPTPKLSLEEYWANNNNNIIYLYIYLSI